MAPPRLNKDVGFICVMNDPDHFLKASNVGNLGVRAASI